MDGCGVEVIFSQVGHAYDSGTNRLDACRNINFHISPGESVALIGPSGCGKSTTLHMAAGLIKPDQGTIEVGGRPLLQPRTETAFIPQDLGLFPWKTTLQNAMLGLTLRRTPKRLAQQMAKQALDQVGLAGFENTFPKELSGGMRQRLALARALAMEADLLLMDEPLSAIDALLRESLQDLLLDLWRTRGHTQLLVTHSIDEAVFLGQRILVFSNRPGTIVDEIENPDAGSDGWRDSPDFAGIQRHVRQVLIANSHGEA